MGPSLHLHYEDRLIVKSDGREFVELGEDGVDQGFGTQRAVAPYDMRETAAAKFGAGIVEVIGDAIGVEQDGVTGLGLEGELFVVARLEKSEGDAFHPQL